MGEEDKFLNKEIARYVFSDKAANNCVIKFIFTDGDRNKVFCRKETHKKGKTIKYFFTIFNFQAGGIYLFNVRLSLHFC